MTALATPLYLLGLLPKKNTIWVVTSGTGETLAT
jgi:hypothetical protein